MGARISTGDEALDKVAVNAHWLIRVAFASIFIYSGIDKFLGGGIGSFAAAMGLPHILALGAACTELGAGILIVIGGVTNGWITRLGFAMTIPILLGAIIIEHWGQWHFMATATHPLGGMMFQVAFLLTALYVVVRGNEF